MKKRKAQLSHNGKPITPMATMTFQRGDRQWFGAFDLVGTKPFPIPIGECEISLRTGGKGKAFITETNIFTSVGRKIRIAGKFAGSGAPPKGL